MHEYLKYQLSETDNFEVDLGGNKWSCGTVVYSIYNKNVSVIIAEHISLIDCGN